MVLVRVKGSDVKQPWKICEAKVQLMIDYCGHIVLILVLSLSTLRVYVLLDGTANRTELSNLLKPLQSKQSNIAATLMQHSLNVGNPSATLWQHCCNIGSSLGTLV